MRGLLLSQGNPLPVQKPYPRRQLKMPEGNYWRQKPRRALWGRACSGDQVWAQVVAPGLPGRCGHPPRILLAEGLQTSRSEEHTSELQSRGHLVCRLLLEKKYE